MTPLILMTVWLLAPVGGAAVVLVSKPRERRWATVGALALTFCSLVGMGLSTAWGASPLDLGPFHVDALPLTVGTAMCFGSVVLVLSAGRGDATGTELAWLLAMLALQSLALLSASLVLLLTAEAAAAGLLAVHASRRGHRAHAAYLSVAGLGLALAASTSLFGQAGMAGPVAVLAVLAALVRLAVFPFSTGILATLERGPTVSTLLASLPFGGALVLIRANPALFGLPEATQWIVFALLFATPLSAALAITQRRLGRSLAYLLAAVNGLVAIGALQLAGSGQVGAELLWAATLLTATGFGAASSLVFLRVGSPDLRVHHGLHASTPFLSVAFLVLGVGLGGAPGTIDFVAEDILLNTSSGAGLVGMVPVVLTIALIGFSVLRLHFRLFFGKSDPARTYLLTKSRERLALVLVGLAVVLGGFAPSLLPLMSAAAATVGH